MTQISKIIKASNRAGIKKTLNMPATAATSLWQINKDSSEIKTVWSKINHFNAITVVNTDSVDLTLRLDGSDNKEYHIASSSIFSIDSIMFQGFDIIPSALSTVDKIKVHMIYERPLLREEPEEGINTKDVGLLAGVLGLIR